MALEKCQEAQFMAVGPLYGTELVQPFTYSLKEKRKYYSDLNITEGKENTISVQMASNK